MRAFITLQMDNPISSDEHFISLGGFEFRFSDGSTQQFDFCESHAQIYQSDPRQILFELCCEDLDCFPEMKTICTRASEIEAFSEFFIYIEDSEAKSLNPVQLLSFEILDDHYDGSYSVLSSDFVKAEVFHDSGEATFDFSEQLLKTWNPTVEHVR